MLYPMTTETRALTSLDGIWSFRLLEGRENFHPETPVSGGIPMPVHCAYNDVYEGRKYRDHIGYVVYERLFNVPAQLKTGALYLRFGSVTHTAEVWLNGKKIGSHKGGFLPFQLDITENVLDSGNRLTVLAGNIVDHSTLPCGTLEKRTYPGLPERDYNFPNFDYFNYSGILRPVVLCAVPQACITDITVSGCCSGFFAYSVETSGKGTVTVEVTDGNAVLASMQGHSGTGKLDEVTLWSCETPKFYGLRVTFTAEDGTLDIYTERFGFREISVHDCGLYLNGKRIRLKGFGKHEDSPVLGRGFSEAYNVKDIALMKWMGANSFRTSHYPSATK